MINFEEDVLGKYLIFFSSGVLFGLYMSFFLRALCTSVSTLEEDMDENISDENDENI